MADGGRFQQAVWRQLDPEAYNRDGLSPTNRAVVGIVATSSMLAILETEPTVEDTVRSAILPLSERLT